jgi:uncharacterized protein (TIGR02246 family)
MQAPRALYFPCALSAAFLLVGCQTASTPTLGMHESDLRSLRDADAAWEHAWSSKDFDKAVAGYAEDATLLVPYAPAIAGRENIRANLKPFFDDRNFSVHWEAANLEVAQSADLGYTQGNLEYTMTDPATNKLISDKAKYMTVWKKQPDGVWRVVEDMFNSNLPLGPPAGK